MQVYVKTVKNAKNHGHKVVIMFSRLGKEFEFMYYWNIIAIILINFIVQSIPICEAIVQRLLLPSVV